MRRSVAAVIVALVLIAGAALAVHFVDRDTTDTSNAAGPAPSRVDVGFAQDMSVHHQQAVMMAAYTQEHAGSAQIRALAGTINSAQQREIGQMIGWLQSWGEPVESDRAPMTWMASDMPMPHASHGGAGHASMPGMATPAQMDRLVNLTGDQLDDRFLILMTRHHEGGVSMAKYAVNHARVGYVRDTARLMIQDQQREIDQMRTLRLREPATGRS